MWDVPKFNEKDDEIVEVLKFEINISTNKRRKKGEIYKENLQRTLVDENWSVGFIKSEMC